MTLAISLRRDAIHLYLCDNYGLFPMDVALLSILRSVDNEGIDWKPVMTLLLILSGLYKLTHARGKAI